MGKNEIPEFAQGTNEILRYTADRTAHGTVTVLCGGDTVAAACHAQLENFTHMSMGGEAALDLLAGKPMPGLDAIPTSWR